MKTYIYWQGNKGEYTGKDITAYGGKFYELLMLEGKDKGKIKLIKQAPRSYETFWMP